MNHFSRLGTLTVIAGAVLVVPLVYAAHIELHPSANSPELLLGHSAQGYLGVGLMDVDGDRAAALKLKEARGAEVITVDQDAPASKAGLKVHDVVVQMNGQRIEGVEQFSRMLHETPPGRTVSLVAMRDGQAVNLSVQLADRAAIAKTILGGLDDDLPSAAAVAEGAPKPASRKLTSRASSLLEPFTRNRYYVGVQVQALSTGLAEYFGVHSGTGVLVGNVFPNSPAAAAGLKVADVIQKVNDRPIVTLSDWERAIRVNHGKQVQLMVIRDKKEQMLSMVAGEAKNTSRLAAPQIAMPGVLTIGEPATSLTTIDAAAMDEEMRQAARTSNLISRPVGQLVTSLQALRLPQME